MDTAPDDSTPTLWTLLRVWTGIGLQSFGGGASTLLLIRRVFVEKRRWVGAEEMGRFWTLCLFTPGINLLALTVLIGRKLGGLGGIVVSLAGLLLPSATVTCLLAAGFEVVQHYPAVHAILQGVIPATAGILGVVGANFAQPLIRQARKEGWQSLSISSAIMLLSALALILFKLSVITVLVGVALLGVVIFTPWRPSSAAHPVPGQAPEDQSV
jgi:chromate transporter